MRAPWMFAPLLAAACSRGPAHAVPTDEAVVAQAGTGTHPPTPSVAPTAKITLTGAAGPLVIDAEVVKSPGRLQRGLMYRKFLGADAGMLFLMGDVDDHHFWMRNTLIPLDIMFISADLRVVGILENVQPLDENSRGVGVPSLYVLEVNGGWSKQHGVAAGTVVSFDGVEAAAQ